MPNILPPVRAITLDDIRAATQRIAGTILRTPLVRLELGPDYPDIRLKLENLQPINAYKLRGAANAVAMLSEAERDARRLDDQRGQRRARAWLTPRERPACRAPSSRSRPRRRRSSSGCARSARS